jgi:hypothetical protein
MLLFKKTLLSVSILVIKISLLAQIKNELAFPLTIPVSLSANFGEYRLNHFHSGIDIKTMKQIGFPVINIYDGYISRIKIQSAAYGKTLYINHPNGITSVYAHLNNFIPQIETFVKKAQYERNSYEIDIFLDSTIFKLKKGDTIAFSGNSGNSSGPHLHFEIRDSKTENVLNPLLLYKNIPDFYPPFAKNIVLYRFFGNGLYNNSKKYFNLKKINDSIYTFDTIILENGLFGIGIETLDFIDNNENTCNIYSLKMTFDNDTLYSSVFDEFSFSETQYINSFLDYSELVSGKKYIQKLFIEPNNNLSIYKSNKNGLISLSDTLLHKIYIEITDIRNNKIKVFFYVKTKPNIKDIFEKPAGKYKKIMPYNQVNTFKNNEISLEFPENSFYDTLLFSYSKEKGSLNFYSYIHNVNKFDVPVHKKFKISILPHNLDESLFQKALICYFGNKNQIIAVGGEFEKNKISAYTGTFGKYFIMIDTIKPVIKPVINKNDTIEKNKIEFKITDDLSGIKNYSGFIDDKWVLFEYDKKNDLITYFFDENITSNMNHSIKIIVTDNRDNMSIYNGTFYY